jgi:2-dehydropantoate 2-reductase
MRLLVVGAGSTGGYFGGRLAAAGRDVTFLVRPRRFEQLRANGLKILSPHGDVNLTPKLILTGDGMMPYDAILLAVKAYSLDDCAPGVGPETMILPVLNGMKHVRAIRDRFGENALVGCVCKIASIIDDQGRIVQLTDLHSLSYGEMKGKPSERMERLDEFMKGAEFDATLSRNIEREMWEKWVMLAVIGAVTCLMRGTIGEVEAAQGGTIFALELLEEVVSTVTALGHPPSEEHIESMRKLVIAKGSATNSSMYRDLQRGGPVEADQILGDLIDLGRAVGVVAPLLSAAYTNLCVYQNRLGAK